MHTHRKARTVLGIAAGAAAVALGAVSGAGDAVARPKGGGLKVVDVNVNGLDAVPQNAIVEIRFSADVDPASVNPAVFQVRERNATGTGFTRQVPGAFQVVGNVVRFFPRLPTNLRDPRSATGDFYAPDTPRDNAIDNAGLKASTSYQVYLVGGGTPDAIRSTRGRRLGKAYSARFSTSPVSPKSDSFTIETYGDSPPPGFQYSNPSDKVASPADQYAKHGGTRDVPNAISVTLFGNRVPLSFSTLRQGTNVTLTLTERNGDPAFTKPINGTPFVEQNFDGTRVVFKPFFPLPDRGTYALRISKDVKDLTEQYDFKNNPERLRLREIYEFMRTAQDLSPGTPAADLPDPPIDLIYDWPTDPAARGVLKENILVLGATYPYEVDPRVMVLFSTRDEPVSNGSVILEFEKNDGLLDESLSTASYDENVPGAASGLLTIAGGSGVNGDYLPVISETINVDNFPNRTINWRKVRIPAGVVLTLRGSRPATIKAFQIEVDGEIRADGSDGEKPSSTVNTSGPSSITLAMGGAGGPGGGRGGNATRDFYTSQSQTSGGTGENGQVGVDVNGNPPQPGEAGGGGFGGTMVTNAASTTIPYAIGSGGGGGGARTAGTNGAGSTAPNYTPSWNSVGGAGGAGSANDDLVPLFGGAGGGAGGNGQYYPYYYPVQYGYYYIIGGAGGGGGGGGLTVQTAGTFTVGTTGAIRSRGGRGGAGSGYSNYAISGGPGGGGGGGTILLRSTKGFNIANAGSATDVRGGAGGTQTGTYTAPSGGTGGTGYVRTEDPNGGDVGIPNASGGVFDPIGGGVPSVLYTKWIDLGVDGPRMVNFTQSDFILNATGNDAIFVEMQMAIEDVNNFGKPLLDALTPSGGTSNTAEVSQWAPVRVTDLTGRPGGAFGTIPGYNPAVHGQDHIFPIADTLNGFSYKFLRVRITFQLDDTQSSRDPFPFVDRMVVNFQFNI